MLNSGLPTDGKLRNVASYPKKSSFQLALPACDKRVAHVSVTQVPFPGIASDSFRRPLLDLLQHEM